MRCVKWFPLHNFRTQLFIFTYFNILYGQKQIIIVLTRRLLRVFQDLLRKDFINACQLCAVWRMHVFNRACSVCLCLSAPCTRCTCVKQTSTHTHTPRPSHSSSVPTGLSPRWAWCMDHVIQSARGRGDHRDHLWMWPLENLHQVRECFIASAQPCERRRCSGTPCSRLPTRGMAHYQSDWGQRHQSLLSTFLSWESN